MLRIDNRVGLLSFAFEAEMHISFKNYMKQPLATLLLSPAHTGGFHNCLWRGDSQADSALIQKKKVMRWDMNEAEHISPSPVVADLPCGSLTFPRDSFKRTP